MTSFGTWGSRPLPGLGPSGHRLVPLTPWGEGHGLALSPSSSSLWQLNAPWASWAVGGKEPGLESEAWLWLWL